MGRNNLVAISKAPGVCCWPSHCKFILLHYFRLAPSPHQSEACLRSGLLWVRSRHCVGAFCLGVIAPAFAGADGGLSLELSEAEGTAGPTGAPR